MHQNIWDLSGSSPGTFFPAKPWNLTQRIDPRQILDSNDVLWCYVVRCCHVLKRDGHTPTTCRNSKILGVMFPFGASGAWSKAQRAEWQHSALHVVDTVVTPVSAASFNVFQTNNFCSAPFRLCLFLVGCLSPQEGQSWTLQRLKTSFQAKASRKYPRRHPNNGGWKLTEITPEPKASWRLRLKTLITFWWLRQDIPMPRCANVSPVARQVPLPPWTLVAQCMCYSQNAQKNHETRIECSKYHEDKPYEMHCN